MNRRTVVGITVVLLLGAGLAAVLALRAPTVDAITVQAAPLVRTLQFSARVATLSRVEIGSTITGRVQQVLVQEGQSVRQGEPLVQLEADEQRSALAQAVAAERQAQARLAGLRSTGRTSSQAALAQAQATLRTAQASLGRAEQLVAQGFYSKAQLDESRRAVAVAQAQYQSAQAQLQANADAGSDIAQAQAQAEAARAATASAQARLEQTQLRAPLPGQVLQRTVEPGQIVQAGKALLRLALAGPTQLVAQVDERFLDQLQTGQPASVVADAFPAQAFAARVLSIAPTVDAQRGAVEVKLSLEQQAPAYLREDMTLSVEVETARREQALALPLSALHSGSTPSSQQATVLVLDQGRAQPRNLRLGLRTLDAVEVLDGLRPGDTVLHSASLPAGQRVQTRPLVWTPGTALSASAAAGKPGGDAGSAMTNAMGR
ncbi:MAG: efflux RND transporter periplasmic adaptor subunit [Giesbergeria sp.]|uniref:efflux RND transporter periplasmic adaptor subunit n=1 Tax=Giesbergeria sp. TaxID=2818473 RepID=UPI00261CAAA5|nr:efflux RND transporter periplasmic adaptor subunit [Giesbergeria sp.]MDD2610415.1 efflux RND transporter periplasmic adaptor subunit [Giesbergeria sp.]